MWTALVLAVSWLLLTAGAVALLSSALITYIESKEDRESRDA